MGFDKAKVIRAAEKYLAQGKISAAIKEYRQIVEHDPDDFTALNMLGDLYVRSSKKQDATECFTRVAEHYREEGFILKAIAMYKKIDKLQPGTLETASKLAALYEMQGLVIDARAHYLVVAEVFARSGQTQKRLETLRKIADLDPHNTQIRLELAAGYLNENFQPDAARAFSEAGTQFHARGNYEQALEAYNRALEINGHDHTALSGLVEAHIALGTADIAAEILERVVAEQPDDLDLLSMLAYVYAEAGDAPAAERVTGTLVARDASLSSRFLNVVRLYLKQDDTAAAVRVLAGIVEPMLAKHEDDELMELLGEALARDPEHLHALRLLIRIHTWQRDDEKLRGALERLVEAASAAGLVDEERAALVQLVRLAPDPSHYYERLSALGGAPEITAEERVPEVETGYEEVPTFESFITLNDDPTATAPAAEFTGFEGNSAATSDSASFANLSSNWTGVEVTAPASSEPSSTDFQEIDFSIAATEIPLQESVANVGADPTEGNDQREALLHQELESVDFYLAQGYTDIAFDTLNMLERQFGAHASITARREELKQTATAASQPDAEAGQTFATPETVEFSNFARYDVAEEASSVKDNEATEGVANQPSTSMPPAKSEPGIDPGLAAIFDEFRNAVEEEEPASADGDYETHYNLGLAYKEMELVDEAIEEFQIAANLTAPQDGTARYLQCCNLIGHCFMRKKMPQLGVMWFKKGLGAPGHTEDEYQALRYELGTAYEQMGDLDGAIATFTEIYGVNVSYRGVSDKLRELQKAVTSDE